MTYPGSKWDRFRRWLEGSADGGLVSGNIAKLRRYGSLAQLYANPPRRAVENLRSRPGSWIWSNDGDNVERLRVLPLNVPLPMELAAVATGTSTILVSWSENFDAFDNVEVWRRTTSEVYSLVATVAPGVKTLTDTGLNPAEVYTYRARFKQGVTVGVNWSNEASAQPFAYAAVTNLAATAVSATRIDLIWSDVATGESNWEVYRKLPSEINFTLLTTIAADSVSYSDTAVPAPETAYEYVVRAVATGLIGELSNVASATSPPTFIPFNPVELVMNGATDLGGGNYRLSNDGPGQYGQVNSKGPPSPSRLRLDSPMDIVTYATMSDPGLNGQGLSNGLIVGFAGDQTITGGGTQVNDLSSMSDVFCGMELHWNAGVPRIRYGLKQLRYSGPIVYSDWVSALTAFDGTMHMYRVSWDPAADKIRVFYDNALIIEADVDYAAHCATYGGYTSVGLVFGNASNLYFQNAGTTCVIRDLAYAGVKA